MQVQPYLYFDGRCEEAVEFYRRVLGAEVLMMMRFKESPEAPAPGMLPPGNENKVMHAAIRIGESILMASDGHCGGKAVFQGVSLSLTVADEAQAEKFFAALADGGKVQMPMTKTFFSPRFGMVADRFGMSWMVLVSDAPSGWSDQMFVATRTLHAPLELVWKAWTERERLMQWFGPKGMTMPTAKLDFRPGGSFHYCLRSIDGHEMWGKFNYLEIVPMQRIVLINSFSDPHGNITTHPMSPNWPKEMLSTTSFKEENGKTIVTIQWTPLNATEEGKKTFAASRAGMVQGWNGTFEQLEAYLAKAQR